jgi:phospho-N-acetylmuramoyl-pentapeptide-transferase
MMYELLFPLSHKISWLSWLNVLRYTPFRAIMATITAMVISFFVAPWFIQKLRGKQISQIIREEGPESHFAKKGTPTMGGAWMLLSVLVPTVLWADVHNVFVASTAIVTAGYGAVGFIDDRMKLMGKNTRGLPGRYKLLGQFTIGGFVMSYLYLGNDLPVGWLAMRDRLAIPFLAFEKHPVSLPIWLYICFAVLFVVVIESLWSLGNGTYHNALRQPTERRETARRDLQTIIIALEKNLPIAQSDAFDSDRRDEVALKLRAHISRLQ